MNDNLKAADLLDAAAELIAQPGAWTQGADARTTKGNPCLPASRRAVCWCALGAIDHACDNYWIRQNATHALTLVTDYDVPRWNDNPKRKQGGVVQALRRAAKKLRS